MTKEKPSIVIEKLGTHLLQVTNNHTGQVSLKWDWDKLLEEVRNVTATKTKAEKVKPNGKKSSRGSRSK